jgi:hypothetical protein
MPREVVGPLSSAEWLGERKFSANLVLDVSALLVLAGPVFSSCLQTFTVKVCLAGLIGLPDDVPTAGSYQNAA